MCVCVCRGGGKRVSEHLTALEAEESKNEVYPFAQTLEDVVCPGAVSKIQCERLSLLTQGTGLGA